MSHEWTLRFLEHRIADKRILRLIAKWLKAGVVAKDGHIERSTRGAPQGAVVSPILVTFTCIMRSTYGSIAGARKRRAAT